MPGFVAMMLIQIALHLAYDLIRPKPEFDAPDSAGLSDFNFPTVGEGRVLPLVWGTVLLSGPMVAWYGNLHVSPVRERYKTGMWTSELRTVGWMYQITLDLVLCSGELDRIVRMWSDGEPVPMGGGDSGVYEGQWVWPQDGGTWTWINVRAQTLYGGVCEEGGLIGEIWVYHGQDDQAVDTHLEDKMGADLPAWNGVAHAVFRWGIYSERGFYFGTSPYCKDIGFEVQRFPNALALTGGDEDIDDDANPACMIYDLLTSSPAKNGLGIPVGEIDLDAFRAVGATLADEGLGLSMVLDKQAGAKDVVLDILRHVDGVVYVEPSTGLLTITLIRFDYTTQTLPVFDETNCKVTSYSRAALSALKNQVRVQYCDRRHGYINKTVVAQNQAAIEAAGGEISTQDLNLRGFSTAENAARACSKALAVYSYPLAALSIESDRSAWVLRPGGVFVLNWPPLGIAGMVCRVSKIGTGELISGAITFDAIEDEFAIDWTAYTPPDESGWIDPAGPVPILDDQEAVLAPYELVKLTGLPEGGAQQAAVVASRADVGISKGFNAIVDEEATPFNWFTPSGLLDGAITESTTTIVADLRTDGELIKSQNDANFDAGYNVAILTGGTDPRQSNLEEFVAFKTVVVDEAAGTITLSDLARGCLDTAPTSFGDETRIWFLSFASGVVNVDGSGVTSIKFQPFNNTGGYDLDLCPVESVTALSTARRQLVYCPTDVQFNSESYPVTISGELTVSWEHRDRLGVWGYANSGETSAPEDGTTYTIKVYGESDTLIHTELALTGTSWLYAEAEEIADSSPLGRLNNSLRVEIFTLCGVYSLRKIVWVLNRV